MFSRHKCFHIIISVLVISFVSTSYAEIIDFESLALNDGDSVGTIGLATFEANASIQGSSYAFIASVGGGTGTSFPFNASGNTFITNPGGVRSDETVKLISIVFSVPISNLSFYVADVDSAFPTIEQLKAEVFNLVGDSLGTITRTAPVGQGNGDGIVTFIDFGNVSGITKVDITLRNIGTNVNATALGFGLDYIEFQYSPFSIEDIITFFDESIADGTLTGDGPGKSANGRLNALRNLLEMAADLINIGEIEDACVQLMVAIGKCDGESPPPDFVTGSAASELKAMIIDLMAELGCE